MIIRSIRLRNFAIFYGQQDLQLEPGLFVIHGVNGRGKTTLLNAVKWALYGSVRDRQRRHMSPAALINRVAFREGERGFAVELTVEDGSTTYLVRRTQAVAEGAASDLYVERNGQPLNKGESLAQIHALLAERVSRFFLFDGEQLQEYERLLSDYDADVDLVKQSIEDILGLPVLANAMEDLAAVREEVERRQAALARADAKAERFALAAQQLEADIDAKQRDLDALHADEAGFLAVIEEKDEFLKDYENSLEALKEIESLESAVSQLSTQRDDMRALRAEAFTHAWRDVLASAVAPLRSELEDTARQAQQAAIARGVSEQLARQMSESIEDHKCALCGRPLDDGAAEHIAAELAQADGDAAVLGDGAHDALVRLARLQPIVAVGRIADTAARDVRVSEIDADIAAREQELRRLRSALDDLPENEVSRAQKDRDQALQDLGQQRAQIQRVEIEMTELREQLTTARASLRGAVDTGEQQTVTSTIDLTEDLLRLFTAGRDQFRDELKDAVEATASDVFLRLTHEPTFTGLRINSNYGLEILDEHDEPAGYRSAGQEQVVALSLIGALNRNARRRAPVIMDTPFGRLDAEHSQNILRFLSEMAEQVFLLVHDREVAQEDLDEIAASITDEFDLRRDGPDHTTIVARRRVRARATSRSSAYRLMRDRISNTLETSFGLKDLVDAYRFALAVALKNDLTPADASTSRVNYIATSTLDSDGVIQAAVTELRNDHDGRPYALVERLAEAGAADVAEFLRSGHPIREYLAPLAGDDAA